MKSIVLAIIVFVCVAPGLVGAQVATVHQGTRQFVFDIGEQPLMNALEAYSKVTGIETLYDSVAVGDHRSPAVRGMFSAGQALQILLSGTSLSARSIAHDAVTIEQSSAPAQQAAGPAPENSAHRDYYSLIQANLEQVLCRDDLRPGQYRAVLTFRIGSNGALRQSHLLGTTGRGDRDRLLEQAVNGIVIGNPPPADLQQPIMIVVLPHSSGHSLQCASIQ